MKYPKPIQDQYRESYNVIKQNLDQIKSIGLEEHKNRFDLFLKEFEKNELCLATMDSLRKYSESYFASLRKSYFIENLHYWINFGPVI